VSQSRTSSTLEIARTFARLGLTSFGGPVAHIGYLRAECVERRRWLSEAEFADLVALCQFLPGPASSQLVLVLGLLRGGVAGGVAASLAFTLPSALLMAALGAGFVGAAGALTAGPWLARIVSLVALVVVARAVYAMFVALCPDAPRRWICAAAAAMLVVEPGASSQFAVLAVGAFAGLWLPARLWKRPTGKPARTPVSRRASTVALVAWASLLVVLPWLATAMSAQGGRLLEAADVFYRAGALVFGGGHVVMPMLQAELVPRGWVTVDGFLAGYGAAQALPGPLFAFSAFLGALIDPARWWLGAAVCLLAVFLPGWLLVVGALPHWNRLRRAPSARGAIAGVSAAVVGLLLAAWIEIGMAAVLRELP
jgi:chromate transporter